MFLFALLLRAEEIPLLNPRMAFFCNFHSYCPAFHKPQYLLCFVPCYVFLLKCAFVLCYCQATAEQAGHPMMLHAFLNTDTLPPEAVTCPLIPDTSHPASSAHMRIVACESSFGHR